MPEAKKAPTEAPATAEVVPLPTLMRRGLTARRKPLVVELPAAPSAAPRAIVLPRADGAPPIPDLSGREKGIIAIGPQGSGKTTWFRADAALLEDAGLLAETVYAAADIELRALPLFIPNVAQPDSAAVEDVEGFIRDFFAMMADPDSRPPRARLDCGGNNPALVTVVRHSPGLVDRAERYGASLIAAYFFTPRVYDLALLRDNVAAGFDPPATMLVLNLHAAPNGLASFDMLREQPDYQAALARGAVEVVMPRLPERVAQEIEAKRLSFGAARDGRAPAGVEPVSSDDAPAVAEWLAQLRAAQAPIGESGWLR